MNKRQWVAVMVLLAGCGRGEPAGEMAGNPANPLEAVARERGIVSNTRSPPTGVFERRHELGRDALCIVPDGGSYRFALSASYGPGLKCTGDGSLTDVDGDWTLAFDKFSDCRIVMAEESDELEFPGELPDGCANVCPARASLSGLRLPRISWNAADARALQLTGSNGKAVAGCDDSSVEP